MMMMIMMMTLFGVRKFELPLLGHAEVKLILAFVMWFEKRVCRMCSRTFASRSRVGEIASLSLRNLMVRSKSLLSSFASTRGLPVASEVSSALYVAASTSMFPNWLVRRISGPIGKA